MQLERLRTSKHQAGANERLAAIAKRHQDGWRCPSAGYKPDRAKLQQKHLFVLDAVQTYTKQPTEQCETCPNWYAGSTFSRATHQAYEWRKTGSLGIRFKNPPAALLNALDVLDAAIKAQEHEANERLKRKLEKQKTKKP